MRHAALCWSSPLFGAVGSLTRATSKTLVSIHPAFVAVARSSLHFWLYSLEKWNQEPLSAGWICCKLDALEMPDSTLVFSLSQSIAVSSLPLSVLLKSLSVDHGQPQKESTVETLSLSLLIEC